MIKYLVLFLILASPAVFRGVRKVLGTWVASAEGLPTFAGLLLHAIIFSLIVRSRVVSGYYGGAFKGFGGGGGNRPPPQMWKNMAAGGGQFGGALGVKKMVGVAAVAEAAPEATPEAEADPGADDQTSSFYQKFFHGYY
jgi:hypothetical protein